MAEEENAGVVWNESLGGESSQQDETSKPPPPPPTPISPPPQQPQVLPSSSPMVPMVPKKPIFQRITEGNIFGGLVFFGILLMFIGAFMIHYSPEVTNYGDNVPSKESVINNDIKVQRQLNHYGSIIADLGIFFLCGILILAALFRTDLSDTIRFGILFAVGLILFGVGFRL